MLPDGTRLGPYVIQAPLGAGGMGEVYRAHDARLGRDVAIKVLPESVSADADRLRRFEQEARAAAALNHPNILAIHDIGTEDLSAPAEAGARTTYVVSELLEGQTLRDLLNGGSVPVRKAIEYSIQVARGLTAAHDKNIVHRDLKPENVFITADGRVKILDFGLAKLVEAGGTGGAGKAGEGNALSMMPTKALDTTPGMVLGTVGYMSPEQVRALAVDHRSDIFSLGAILYELLSGRRAFRGETTADTMTAILKEEPPDLPTSERGIPPALARIVDRAMEKSPAARFQSASDFAFALEGLSSASASYPGSVPAVVESRRSRSWMPWAIAALLAVVAAGLATIAYRASRPIDERSVRATLLTPEGWTLDGVAPPNRLAVSPDGTKVAFTARRGSDRQVQIWVRRIDGLAAQPLAGTEGGKSPFWSPDSRVVGFFAGNKMKRIDTAGGPATTLCDVAGSDPPNATVAASWSQDNVILFGAPGAGLRRVPAAGGTATEIIKQESGKSNNFPWFLPDGKHFLFRTGRGAPDAEVVVASLDGGAPKVLMKGVSQAMFAQRHLLFVREGTLMAQPFDASRFEIAGEAFPVAESIQTGGGNSAFSVSVNGVLIYQTGSGQVNTDLVWIDRTGKQIGTLGDTATWGDLNLSPDGTRAVVSLQEPGQTGRDLWIFDLARGNKTRFTFDPGDDRDPVWSPDSTLIVFTSDRRGANALYRKASGGGPEEPLQPDGTGKFSLAWSSHGKLLFLTTGGTTGQDLWTLPISANGAVAGKPTPFLQSPFNEAPGSVSPDGRWIAYASNESGLSEVYVGPAEGPPGVKWQISTNTGTNPRWRSDGKEIYYRDNASTAIMAVEVNGSGSRFEVVGAPRTVAQLSLAGPRHTFDVTRDGQKFLVSRRREAAEVPPVTLVVNWLQGH